ncbi:MAG: hypothetical protein Q8K55_11100 [Gemmatimonadaceae bacterium]|nr:hypothetical protein [Gemmatimonadaceae bacterium]
MHTPKFFLGRGRRAALSPFLLAVAALALSACDDPFKLKASYTNEPFVYSLYGISGTGPANAPAALDLVGRSPVRVDGNFNFDIAFDFDGTGKIVILPQKLVGTPITGSRVVALQRISGSYESVMLAPTNGWQLDSAVTLLVGEVVGVRLTSASCAYQMSSEMYAKIVVDSVKTGGLLFGRGVINPNCGFKSFAEGIPEK